MKWAAPSVARFAGLAGFMRPELHTATAIALAATNGIDHYDHRAGLPGSGRWTGLWAVNVDRWPEYTPDELFDPQRAAEAAYELTRRCDGFGWSDVWNAHHDLHYLAQAATAYTLEPFRERSPAPIRTYTARRELDALAVRCRSRTRHG